MKVQITFEPDDFTKDEKDIDLELILQYTLECDQRVRRHSELYCNASKELVGKLVPYIRSFEIDH